MFAAEVNFVPSRPLTAVCKAGLSKETFALPSSYPKGTSSDDFTATERGSERGGSLLHEPNACFASGKMNLVHALSLAPEALCCSELNVTPSLSPKSTWLILL